ncbi:MAG: alpha/beta hydrolase, partial [Halobacteria archaeon]|nr:alpha/beta hydrolase [Halobacteria archaeon]
KETLREGETVEASLLYYRSFFEEFLSKPSDALEVRGIDVSTLLLTGKNDGCISPELFGNSERCYDARSEFERINGAGHFVHAEKPDEVADRVLEFVGRK